MICNYIKDKIYYVINETNVNEDKFEVGRGPSNWKVMLIVNDNSVTSG